MGHVRQAIVVFHTDPPYDELPPLDESSIDALVSDSDLDFQGPGTPAVPPGLGFSHPHHPLHFGDASSIIQPALPQVVPSPRLAQSAIIRPVTPLTPLKPRTASKQQVKPETPKPSSSAKKTIKELAVESGLSKDIAAQAAAASRGKAILHEEDFPALDSIKATASPRVTPALPTKPTPSQKGSQNKKAQLESSGKGHGAKSPSKKEKRSAPAVLDISAATSSSDHGKDRNSSPDYTESGAVSPSHGSKSVASSALPTPTLTAASTASPVARTAPKTLRLVQTPKAEFSPSIPPSVAASIRSAAAIAGGHRPGTPASEFFSDTASIMSTSMSVSRTSSPPPSRIGSASARTKTKSQQRKERNKANKEATDAILAEPKPVEEEVVVAPIIGRKKKQKKEKKEKTSSSQSRTGSRPGTPPMESGAKLEASTNPEVTGSSTDTGDEKVKGRRGRKQSESPARRSKVSVSPSKSSIDTSIKLNESTKTTVLAPDFVHPPAEVHQEVMFDEGAVGEVPSLSEILQSLIEEGELPEPDDISLFKPLQNTRADFERSSPPSQPPSVKSVVTKEDEAELNAFRPVHKEVDGHRVLLTPNGDFVLNLTEEEERRFLALQASVAQSNGLPTAFTAPKHTPGTGFSLIKGRAVPNGMPSFFPAGPDAFPPDPVGKMHREEAIGCINQHVLPSLNLGSYNHKPYSSFPNANGVNLQSLAPWISSPDMVGKDGRRFKLPRGRESFDGASTRSTDSFLGRMSNSDNPNENWDDEDDIGGNGSDGPSPAIGSTPLMSVEEAEQVLAAAKKQHEATDKKFKQATIKLRRQLGLH